VTPASLRRRRHRRSVHHGTDRLRRAAASASTVAREPPRSSPATPPLRGAARRLRQPPISPSSSADLVAVATRLRPFMGQARHDASDGDARSHNAGTRCFLIGAPHAFAMTPRARPPPHRGHMGTSTPSAPVLDPAVPGEVPGGASYRENATRAGRRRDRRAHLRRRRPPSSGGEVVKDLRSGRADPAARPRNSFLLRPLDAASAPRRGRWSASAGLEALEGGRADLRRRPGPDINTATDKRAGPAPRRCWG